MKIIANGIANLTDARYFAAMGVDWIGFNLGLNSPLTIEHVMAFANWVEGPKFFLDVRGRIETEIAEMLGNFQAAGLLSDARTSLQHYAGKTIGTLKNGDGVDSSTDTLIYTLEQWQQDATPGNSIVVEEVWVEISNVEEFENLKGSIEMISGIVVSGGDEQKVGIKSYDDLDELFEFVRS